MSDRDNLQIKKHEGRDDLAGEHPQGDAGQIILFILFVVVIVSDLIFINWLAEYRSLISYYIRIPAAVVFILLSLYLFKASHKAIFETRREKLAVIRDGVYARVRHPMYMATLVLLFGVIVLTLSAMAFFVWLVLFAFYYYIARYEEKILVDLLGHEYEDYRRKVKMFIPGIF